MGLNSRGWKWDRFDMVADRGVRVKPRDGSQNLKVVTWCLCEQSRVTVTASPVRGIRIDVSAYELVSHLPPSSHRGAVSVIPVSNHESLQTMNHCMLNVRIHDVCLGTVPAKTKVWKV